VIALSARSPSSNQKADLFSTFGYQSFAVTTRKFFYAAGRIYKLLFACKKRVTSRTDTYFDVATGRPGVIVRTAGAHNRGLNVIRMNAGLHY